MLRECHEVPQSAVPQLSLCRRPLPVGCSGFARFGFYAFASFVFNEEKYREVLSRLLEQQNSPRQPSVATRLDPVTESKEHPLNIFVAHTAQQASAPT